MQWVETRSNWNETLRLLLLLLPLPVPFSNVVPAWGVMLIAAGLLERDGGFILAGIAGFVWLFFWFPFYTTPDKSTRLNAAENALIHSDLDEKSDAEVTKASWGELLSYRQTWSFIVAKFMTDPIWWFFLFWLPGYLGQRYNLDLKTFALPIAVITRFIGWFHDFGIPVGGVIVNMLIDKEQVTDGSPEFVKNRVAMQQEHMETIWKKFDGSVRAVVPAVAGAMRIPLWEIVAIFLVFCIFYMIVAEKTRDIGIMKSLGASNGGVMNIVTRSGTNAFKGTIFGFLRDEKFNANTFENIAAGRATDAAYRAMEHRAFYDVTLKNFAMPWTNRDQTVFAPLNDYTATVIGMVRDDVPFDVNGNGTAEDEIQVTVDGALVYSKKALGRPTALVREFLQREAARLEAFTKGGGTEDASLIKGEMQDLMTAKVGIFRTGADLEEAVVAQFGGVRIPHARRQELLAGARDTFPLLLGAFPFGMIYGAVAATSGLSPAAVMAQPWAEPKPTAIPPADRPGTSTNVDLETTELSPSWPRARTRRRALPT